MSADHGGQCPIRPRSVEGKRESEGNKRRFFPRWVQGESPPLNENPFCLKRTRVPERISLHLAPASSTPRNSPSPCPPSPCGNLLSQIAHSPWRRTSFRSAAPARTRTSADAIHNAAKSFMRPKKCNLNLSASTAVAQRIRTTPCTLVSRSNVWKTPSAIAGSMNRSSNLQKDSS